MKKIRLILETYRQNVVPSILVLVIMTISLLVMTVSLGQYRLSTYTLDLLAHAGLENADYFMQELSGPGSLDEAYTQQLIEKMDSYSIVAEVLKAQFAVTEYKKVRHVVMLYDAPMQAAFPLRVTRGKWMPGFCGRYTIASSSHWGFTGIKGKSRRGNFVDNRWKTALSTWRQGLRFSRTICLYACFQ